MTTPTNGGPAYPCDAIAFSRELPENTVFKLKQMQGMSLRDWFAGQAMLGQLASPLAIPNDDRLASYSYQIADAMLRARNQLQ